MSDDDDLPKLTPDEYRKVMRRRADERRRQRALTQGDKVLTAKNIDWPAELAAAVAANETAIVLAARIGCAESSVRYHAKRLNVDLAKYLRQPPTRNVYYAIEKTREKSANNRLGSAFAFSADRMQSGLSAPSLGVYVIEEVGTHHCKIGIASDPNKRRSHLSLGNPRELIVTRFTPVFNPRRVEYAAHSELWPKRVAREWFAISSAEASSAIDAAIVTVGSQTDDGFVSDRTDAGWPPQHGQFSHIGVENG